MDKQTRSLIQKATQDARRVLEYEFAEQLEGTFDILPSGQIAMAAGAHLDDDQKIIREKIIAAISHEIAGGMSGAEAVAHYLREAAFTFLNRFAALKMLEARDLVQQCVSNAGQSSGFKEFCGLAPGLTTLPDKGYRLYIESLFDELGMEIRVLFDRRNPASLVWPRKNALDGLLDIFNREEIVHVWGEDETIGWVYQYFNSAEERKKMREASQAPRNSRELAVRNQFFTPRYVVAFLTDNTLGRIWYEMRQANTRLKDQCQYIVIRPKEHFLKEGESAPEETTEDDLSQEELLRKPVYVPFRQPKDPRDIRMLDPACGSLHFGLYAFDLYETIYEEAWDLESTHGKDILARPEGLKPLTDTFPDKDAFLKDVPWLIIEHNIHGIDIDPRAVQIGTLALWMRAQRSWQRLGIKATDRPRVRRSNIVTAEPMPGEKDMLKEFSLGLYPRVLGQLVEVIFDKMQLAGEAGSLLKIEEEIKDAVAEAREQWLKVSRPEQQLLFSDENEEKPKQQELRFDVSDVTDEAFWEQAEDRILDALKTFSEKAGNGRASRRRLFAEDAARGFAFIDLFQRQYDAVLMNPPFGESGKDSKQWIVRGYPTTKNDILGPFLERGILVLNDKGSVGAITARTAFQLSSMEGFRKELILKKTNIRAFADLGGEVLDSAMVKTAAYALTKSRDSLRSVFINLTGSKNKGTQLALTISDGLSDENVFLVNQDEFNHIPGAPLAYWADHKVRKCFAQLPSLSSIKAEVKQGLGTTDDFRFVRVVWEVPSALMGMRKRWFFYAKGGESNDFYSDVHLVVNWADGGREVYEYNGITYGGAGAPIRNPAFYFKPGLTYTSYTNKGFSPRVLPAGCIFTTAGMGIFLDDPLPMLSLLNSQVIQLFLLMITDERKWEVGYVRSIPIKSMDSAEKKRFSELSIQGWREVVLSTSWDETQRFFNGFTGVHQISSLQTEVERLQAVSQNSANKLERIRRQIDEQTIALYGLTAQQLKFVDTRLRLEKVEKFKTFDISNCLLSLFLGTAFGRWDIRIILTPSLVPALPEPFDPLPVSQPAMLVGPEGLPAEPTRIASEEWLRARPDANTLPPEGSVKKPTIPASEYPLRISWDGILVDDAGFKEDQLHKEDIIRRVREVLDVVWKNKATEIEQEACDLLKAANLRAYFRKSFFPDHIKRYSKSRRKAPIYWQLSTPSASYSVWLYYHRFTKDTIYKVNKLVTDKLQFEERELTNVRQQYGPEPSAGQRKEIAARETFVEEIKVFKDEVARVAPLWNPDLNDGVIINFAPLWRLVPQNRSWQKECKKVWEKLINEDYNWAHLAMHLWPERVVPKCAKDRSLAIAHGLDEVFWEEDDKGKPKSKKVSKEKVEALIAERTAPTVKAALEDLIKADNGAPASSKQRKRKS